MARPDPAPFPWRTLLPLAGLAVAVPWLSSHDPLGRETPRVLALIAGALLVWIVGSFPRPRWRGVHPASWFVPAALLALAAAGTRDLDSLRAGTPLVAAAALAVAAGGLGSPRAVTLLLAAVVGTAGAVAALGVVDAAQGGAGVAGLGNPNRVGEYVVTALPAGAALYLLSPGRAWSLLGLAAMGLGFGQAAVCASRGGLGVGVLEIGLVALLAVPAARSGAVSTAPLRRLGALVLAAAGVAAALWILPATRPRVQHAVERVTNSLSPHYPANRVRLGLARGTSRLVTEHPWGTGTGTFRRSFAAYRDPVEHRTSGWAHPVTHAHNQYLNSAAEAGVPGGLLVLLLFGLPAFWLLRGWRGEAQPRARVLRLAAGVTLAGSGLESLIATPLLNPAALTNAALLAGAAAATRRPGDPAPRPLETWPGPPGWIWRAAGVVALVGLAWLAWPSWTGYRWRLQARKALEHGDAAGAETAWRRAAEAEPGDPELWQRLARVQVLRKRSQAALDSFSRALDAWPDFPYCLLARADLLADRNEYARARIPVQRLSDLQPWNPHPHYLLGKIYLAAGHPDLAEAAYRSALAADRKAHPDAAGPYEPAPVARHAQRDLAALLLDRAERIEKHQGLTRAFPAYQAVLSVDPRHPVANLRVARGLKAQGRTDEAARHRYVGLLEDGLQLLRTAVRLRREAGSIAPPARPGSTDPLFEKAVRRLTEATFQDPDNPVPYYYLAVARTLRNRAGVPYHDPEQARIAVAEAKRRGLERLEDTPDQGAYRAVVAPIWNP